MRKTLLLFHPVNMVHRIVVLILLIFPLTSESQRKFSVDEFIKQLDLYRTANPNNLLFVHTDKAVYVHQEDLYFSAYLLKSETVNLDAHTVLSISLVQEGTRKAYLQRNFLMKQGLAFGNLTLPDSIPAGDYRLIAFTNLVDGEGLPSAVFQQSIRVMRVKESRFDLGLTRLDSIPVKGVVRFRAKVEFNASPDDKQKTILSYRIGAGSSTIMKLDRENSAIISIPVHEIATEDASIHLTASRGAEKQYLSAPLSLSDERPTARIHFFPEGGYLVAGLTSEVGWEVSTSRPVLTSVRAILYENEDALDTLESNVQGIGRFRLTPKPGVRYSLRITDNRNLLFQENDYPLPAILSEGVVVNLTSSVVNDTLRFNVYSSSDRKLTAIIHDYREGYVHFPLVGTLHGKRHIVALPELPRGLVTLTILDEKGRPVAERLFFARYDSQPDVGIELDRHKFLKREEVKIKLKLKDRAGEAMPAITSVAVVQEDRLMPEKQSDIVQFALLESALGELPVDPFGRKVNNRDYMEAILLVKGWRKYNWPGLQAVAPIDTISHHRLVSFKGLARYQGRPVDESVTLTLMKGLEYMEPIETDQNGNFYPSADLLVVKPGQRMLASVERKNKADYTIELPDPFTKVADELSNLIKMPLTKIWSPGSLTSREQVMTGLEHVKQLEEVTITATGNNGIFYGQRKGDADECADFVLHGKLYYPHESPSYAWAKNNVFKTKPEVGKSYVDGNVVRWIDDGSLGYRGAPGDEDFYCGRRYSNVHLVYKGCMADHDQSVFKLPSIYTDKTFYGFDVKLKDIASPQYLSTLYWKPGLLVDENGEAVLSFYTGDITGKFKVIVQGVGSHDVLYGENTFSVQ